MGYAIPIYNFSDNIFDKLHLSLVTAMNKYNLRASVCWNIKSLSVRKQTHTEQSEGSISWGAFCKSKLYFRTRAMQTHTKDLIYVHVLIHLPALFHWQSIYISVCASMQDKYKLSSEVPDLHVSIPQPSLWTSVLV